MVIQDQQGKYQENADLRTFPEGEQQGEQHEKAELTQDVGRAGGISRHAQLLPSQRDSHRQPEEEELTKEKRNTLAPEGTFQGRQGGFMLGVHLFRILVQVEIDPPLVDRQYGVLGQRYGARMLRRVLYGFERLRQGIRWGVLDLDGGIFLFLLLHRLDNG